MELLEEKIKLFTLNNYEIIRSIRGGGTVVVKK